MGRPSYQDDEFPADDSSLPDQSYRRKGSLLAQVLHADADLIVVNKPPVVELLATFPDEPSVELQLRRTGHLATDEPATSLYPLDASLSGLAILGRGDALEAMQAQIAADELTLTCLALIRAYVSASSGQIDIPLGPSPRGEEFFQIQPGGSISAVTQWRLRDTFVGFALVECMPSLAQPNQIRAHLPAAGMPLIVDPLHRGGGSLMLSSFKAGYRPSRRRPEHALIDRPTLHVLRLVFDHPTTHQPLSFEADLPKDFRATLHQLDRFGRLPSWKKE
jgi:23S rRNA-/tRNA-specific pseudouridylate synthase